MKWIRKIIQILQILFGKQGASPEQIEEGYKKADDARAEAAENKKEVIEDNQEDETEEKKKEDIDVLQGRDTF